jgi:hypothetical protein
MKNTTKTTAGKLILALIPVLFMGAHGYSNDRENGGETIKSNTGYDASVKNLPVVHKYGKQSTSRTVILPAEVKNIWKDMPSYDRYGNEITSRARFNMKQNAMLTSTTKNSSAAGTIVKEIK